VHLPATAKGVATRRRILDAAAAEFAQFGIAGARVDRITAAAQTNKAQVYGYFGSKDALFDAVLADAAERSSEEAPFDADDLPGWAVRIHDEVLRNPDVLRLLTWLRLERRPDGPGLGALDLRDDLDRKLAAVAAAQAAGRVRAGDPAEVLTLVMGMASAWSPVGNGFDTAPSHDHARRRALLRETVQRAIAP
jgi:AcrR family transcriptional regulator